MKVKLLKKVRKRFIIMFNDTGVFCWSEKTKFKYLVYDDNNQYSYHLTDSFNDAKEWILKKVRKEYSKKSTNKDLNVKVWHVCK